MKVKPSRTRCLSYQTSTSLTVNLLYTWAAQDVFRAGKSEVKAREMDLDVYPVCSCSEEGRVRLVMTACCLSTPLRSWWRAGAPRNLPVNQNMLLGDLWPNRFDATSFTYYTQTWLMLGKRWPRNRLKKSKHWNGNHDCRYWKHKQLFIFMSAGQRGTSQLYQDLLTRWRTNDLKRE